MIFYFGCNFIALLVFIAHLALFNALIANSQEPGTKPIISFCIGGGHGCAVFDNKEMKCFGVGSYFGYPNVFIGDSPSELGDNLLYLNVSNVPAVEKVFCGFSHTCMILENGDMKCIGSNQSGGIGIGVTTSIVGMSTGYEGDNLPSVDLGGGLKVLDISLGYSFSCAIVTGNRVKCFGYNSEGQIGYGNATPLGSDPAHMGENLEFVDLGTNVETLSIHSALYRSCAILSAPEDAEQRMKCWGRGNAYHLGYGDSENRGDNPNEMGDNLPLVDLGSESRVKQLSLGYTHSCALLANNNMKCWGSGDYGQLGSGDTATISTTGDSIPILQVDSGKTIKSISAGSSHSCILYNDDITFKCFGDNSKGQLGQGDKIRRGISLTTTIPNILPIELGMGSLKILSIYAGENFNCIIFTDFSVKCFGQNNFGQCAIGTATSGIGDEQNEMGTNLKSAVFFPPTASPTNSPTQAPTPSPTTLTKPPTVRSSSISSLQSSQTPLIVGSLVSILMMMMMLM